MSRKYTLSGLFIFLLAVKGIAQVSDSTFHEMPQEKKFKISGYIDAYYAYYTDSAGANDFQKFPSVSPRSNRFWLNTAQVSFDYNAEKIRGIVTLHFGDIAKTAWPSTFNNIMEAHAGFRVFKTLWLDAGFFRTHFGTEGLLPKENLVSSISVHTFCEPYYEAGLRLNYVPNDRWAFTVYGLNGYNMFEDNNKKKSIGALITYTHGDYYIGYSNYIGDDSPKGDSVSHLRILQNIFFNYQHKKLKIQAGVNYGIQQNADIMHPNLAATMISGILGLKYQLKEKFAVSARAEIFKDPQGFMSAVILNKDNFYTGYKVRGYTLATEYKPTKNSYIKIEGRQLQMEKNQEIFNWNGKPASSRLELLCNIGISF